ncbi:MAG: HU family DNA-binding protein [Candidatus Eisenbacteria sp.]|nr:HU family DNA-binding protein [Candidatus Eisenbacteria bacterium]
MTKTDLINSLLAEAVKDAKSKGKGTEPEFDKRQVKLFLDMLTEVVRKEIKKAGEVPLTGLGKFKVQKRKARIGRNPQTGEAIKIPAKKVVKFTVAKALKDLIAPPKKKATKKTAKKKARR